MEDKNLMLLKEEYFRKEKKAKGYGSILDCVACVAKIYDHKVSDRKHK